MLPPFTVTGTVTEVCCKQGESTISNDNSTGTDVPGPKVCWIGDANQTNHTDYGNTTVLQLPELFIEPDYSGVGNGNFFNFSCTTAPTSPSILSPYEEKLLVWLPRVLGPISLACSLWILIHVARDKKRRQNSYHRLVWAMTTINFASTIWISLTSLPTPSMNGYNYGAKGNQVTCDTQGWFVQLNIGTPLYHASLALYYYLRLCRRWTESDIRRYAEPFIHLFVIGFSLITATVGLIMQLYNPSLWCWIYALPYGCEADIGLGCLRGNHATVYQWGLFYGPLWFMIFWMTFMLLLIYLHVRKQEQKTAQYMYHNTPSRITSTVSQQTPKQLRSRSRAARVRKKRSHARAVATNAAFYVSSFYIVWLGPTLCDVVFDQARGTVAPFWLYMFSTCMLPLQGFFNFLVYIRPKVMQQYRRYYQKESDRERGVNHNTTSDSTEVSSIRSKLHSASIFLKSTAMGFWKSIIFSNPEERENVEDWKLGTPDEPTEDASIVQSTAQVQAGSPSPPADTTRPPEPKECENAANNKANDAVV
jgi:hypothetical protein